MLIPASDGFTDQPKALADLGIQTNKPAIVDPPVHQPQLNQTRTVSLSPKASCCNSANRPTKQRATTASSSTSCPAVTVTRWRSIHCHTLCPRRHDDKALRAIGGLGERRVAA
jgi:hypothetical protein